MKNLNLVFIVLGLFLFGCNQTDSKNKLTEENSTKPTEKRTLKQEKLADHEEPKEDKIDNINNIMSLFKEKNIDKISSKIKYPLNRKDPIPPIKDREEFRQRFSEVFDKILIEKIANAKIDQWSKMGSRTMFDNGTVWIANSDGKITSVTYQSDFEKKLMNDLIGKEKENLHSSLKTFEKPIFKIKTEKYLIRIDELTNHKYRYASWKISEKESSKPDLILDNGELTFQGSGGNHTITFANNNYTYKIYRNRLGTRDSPDITLTVEKDGKIILTQDGTLEK